MSTCLEKDVRGITNALHLGGGTEGRVLLSSLYLSVLLEFCRVSIYSYDENYKVITLEKGPLGVHF